MLKWRICVQSLIFFQRFTELLFYVRYFVGCVVCYILTRGFKKFCQKNVERNILTIILILQENLGQEKQNPPNTSSTISAQTSDRYTRVRKYKQKFLIASSIHKMCCFRVLAAWRRRFWMPTPSWRLSAMPRQPGTTTAPGIQQCQHTRNKYCSR